MAAMETTYRAADGPSGLAIHIESGRTPPRSLLAACGVGAFAASSFGAVYACLSVALPWVIVRLGLPLLLGALVGLLAVYVMDRFQVRRRAVVLATALSLGGIAWVAAWPAWAYVLLLRGGAPVSAFDVLDPTFVLGVAASAFESGTWALGRSGDPVSGGPLAAAWVGELTFILGFAFQIASLRSRDRVFCESCGTWCTLARDRARYDVTSGADLRRALVERGDLDALESTPGTSRRDHWLSLTLGFCAHCGKTNVLAIHDVSPTRARKRGLAHTEQLLLPYHLVTEAQMRRLRELFRC